MIAQRGIGGVRSYGYDLANAFSLDDGATGG
jgi:hypothetical protein